MSTHFTVTCRHFRNLLIKSVGECFKKMSSFISRCPNPAHPDHTIEIIYENGAYFSIRNLHNFYYPVQLGVLKANPRFFLLKRILFMVAGAHIFEKVKNYDCRHQLEKLKAETFLMGGME